MDQALTRLEYRIDAMYLIHKALRGEAERTERLARDVEVGCSLQPFTLAFTVWATALVYHAEKELGTQLSTFVDRVQVASTDPVERVQWAMVGKEDEEHGRLLNGVQEVMTVLEEDIGASSVISRTKQHLASQVIALRIAQEDHLETEEFMVLPLVREGLSEEAQLEVVGGLLIDDQAQDQRWVIDWISQGLTRGEWASWKSGSRNAGLAHARPIFQRIPEIQACRYPGIGSRNWSHHGGREEDDDHSPDNQAR